MIGIVEHVWNCLLEQMVMLTIFSLLVRMLEWGQMVHFARDDLLSTNLQALESVMLFLQVASILCLMLRSTTSVLLV